MFRKISRLVQNNTFILKCNEDKAQKGLASLTIKSTLNY